MSAILKDNFVVGEYLREKWLLHKVGYSRTPGPPHVHLIHVIFSYDTMEAVSLAVVKAGVLRTRNLIFF